MPTLALSMIVKNEERDLPACLESVRGAVNEIIVADTGSTDSSIEIARAAGARVLSIPWDNDFAKARNLSLDAVTADWVLMLDADERLDPGAPAILPGLLARDNVAGYQVTIRNYVHDLGHKIWDRTARPNDSAYPPARDYAAYVDHENVRLFRRDPAIRFTGRVHETVGWSILDAGRSIATANFVIHHMGITNDLQSRARKILFYLNLGKLKVADMPDNRQAHFELGVSELENLGNAAEALASFKRSREIDPKFALAWFFSGVCHFRLGEFPAALNCFHRAEALGHLSAAVAEILGDTFYNLGEFDEAASSYRRGLKRTDPAQPSAAAPIESKLGWAEARAGKVSSGVRRLRQAVSAQPANPELHDRLIVALVWLNRVPEAAEAAENKLTAVPARPEDFLRAASIHGKMVEWSRAASILERGLLAFPEASAIRAKLSEIETLLTPST